jgi:hypothetical protein
MLGDGETVAWLTPHTAVAREGRKVVYYYWRQLEGFMQLLFQCRRQRYSRLGSLPRAFIGDLRCCSSIVGRASVVHSVMLHKYGFRDGALFNAASLAYLMEQCQCLKTLSLVGLTSLQEDHIRVPGTYSRPGLEIELKSSQIVGAAAVVLAQVLGRNQGPTKLNCYDFDNSVLADGLRGNSRLKCQQP